MGTHAAKQYDFNNRGRKSVGIKPEFTQSRTGLYYKNTIVVVSDNFQIEITIKNYPSIELVKI